MSRLVFYLGILLMILGAVGLMVGLITVPTQIISTVSEASNPDVKALCKPGETVATEVGPEEYNPSEQVYSRSTTFYCINDAGVRRDVTQQFAEGFIQRMIGSFGSVVIPALACVSCTFGFILALFGGIFFFRRRAVNVMVRQNVSLSNYVLDAKLAQLEEARSAGLITEDEYQRMRKDALDSLS